MKTTLALLVTLATACAPQPDHRYVGTTEDGRVVEISIADDVVTGEIGGESFTTTLSLDPEISLETFEAPCETGALIDGVVAELVIGSITDANGERRLFSATDPDGYGVVTQADYTFTNANTQYCVCNGTYHRVYCQRIDGSWYWNGNYC